MLLNLHARDLLEENEFHKVCNISDAWYPSVPQYIDILNVYESEHYSNRKTGTKFVLNVRNMKRKKKCLIPFDTEDIKVALIFEYTYLTLSSSDFYCVQIFYPVEEIGLCYRRRLMVSATVAAAEV